MESLAAQGDETEYLGVESGRYGVVPHRGVGLRWLSHVSRQSLESLTAHESYGGQRRIAGSSGRRIADDRPNVGRAGAVYADGGTCLGDFGHAADWLNGSYQSCACWLSG